MKNFKKAVSLLAGISLTATSAMAATLNVNYGSDDRLSITGTDFTNGAVSITVAHSSEGDTYSASTKFAAIKELIPDYEGNISFTTPLPSDAVSGNYVVTAYDKSGEVKQIFFYVNKAAAQAAFDALDGDLTDAEFASTLEQYKVELGIGDDLNDPTLDITETAKWFRQFNTSDALNVDIFNVCWLSSKLCGGKAYTAEEFVAEIDANSDLLGVTKDGEKLIPYASLDTEDKAKVFETFKAIDKDADTFVANLNEAALLAGINEPDITRKDFEKLLLEDYSEYLDLDTADFKSLQMPDSVITALMSSTYKTSDELKKAFYDEVSNQQYNETPKNQGGSSGGGGGGGVSASGSYDNTPIVPTPTPDTTVPTPAVSTFDDMKDHWATDAVEALKAKGIVNGVGDNLFAPERELTRAEFAKMIAESFFASAQAGTASFADVASDSWYASYVSKLASLGIVNGTDSEHFSPDLGVTREAAAVIMHRTAKLVGVSLSPVRGNAAFADTISDYAKDAVAELYSAGLINGLGTDTFSAYTKLTRAQAAQLVYNMMK